MDVTIRGITFPDIDLTDADVVEAYDAGIAAVKSLKRPQSGDVKGTADFIREFCDVLRTWFDEILGDEAGDSILPRDSLYEGTAAFRELIEAQQRSNQETEALFADLDIGEEPDVQSLSRQQRRAQKRQAQRSKRKRERQPEAVADLYAPERVEQ